MHVENMTILQEIVLTLERKETWNSYNMCYIWKSKITEVFPHTAQMKIAEVLETYEW